LITSNGAEGSSLSALAGEAQLGSEAASVLAGDDNAGHQCPPCAQRVNLDTSVLGVDDELLQMSQKAFACNTQKAMEDLTSLHHGAERMKQLYDKNKQDRVRHASFGVKLMKAQEEEKAFRFCMKTMMPDLLGYWDRKAKEGKLPTWTEANERARAKGGGATPGGAVQVESS
jgi:hypothetical protein